MAFQQTETCRRGCQAGQHITHTRKLLSVKIQSHVTQQSHYWNFYTLRKTSTKKTYAPQMFIAFVLWADIQENNIVSISRQMNEEAVDIQWNIIIRLKG